ncbi:MAG: RNA polymerase sigma factor region1.1 domain-containing protein, partial [Sphaerochaetaceae bacterium]|nr:RNA polymerase sigma factor region1.1 domain-containing protein [Sphaerochaetaceae bacterium]
MSEIEKQDYFMKLVTKGKREGRLTVKEIDAILPSGIGDDEEMLEEVFTLLEKNYGILISDEDMENDLIENVEEKRLKKSEYALDQEETLQNEIHDPSIDEELDETEVESDLDESTIDGELSNLPGISTSRRHLDDLDEEKVIEDHDDEIIDEDDEDEDLDDDDEDDEEEEDDGEGVKSAYSKADLSS